MKPDTQDLWDSRIVERIVIQTLIDGLKIVGKKVITVTELEELQKNMKRSKN